MVVTFASVTVGILSGPVRWFAASLSVGHGTLTGTGFTGSGTASLTFSGTLAALNAALVWLMRLETAVLRAPPLGTSVMYAGLKVSP